jgi:hypothetical protein
MSQKNSEAMKKRWKNPEYRDKKLKQMEKYFFVPGRKHTEEWKKEQSIRNKEMWKNPEFKEKQSKISKKNWENPEYAQRVISSMEGHPVSEETRQKISIANTGHKASEECKQKMSEWVRDEECKQKMSEKAIEGMLNGTRNKFHGRGGIREDLKEYGFIRSMFEANMIRYLKFKNETFEYQVPILLSNDRYYICDFYLPNKHKLFLEVKGYLYPGQKEKYDLLQRDYPKMNWIMLMQKGEEWRNINKQFKDIIPNWEKEGI